MHLDMSSTIWQPFLPSGYRDNGLRALTHFLQRMLYFQTETWFATCLFNDAIMNI